MAWWDYFTATPQSFLRWITPKTTARVCHFKSFRRSTHTVVSLSVFPLIAEELAKSHALLSLLMTLSTWLSFARGKERLIFCS